MLNDSVTPDTSKSVAAEAKQKVGAGKELRPL